MLPGVCMLKRAKLKWTALMDQTSENFFFFFLISTDLSGAPLNKQACCLPIGHGTYRWTMGRLVTASLICFSCSLQLKGFKGSPANFSLSDTFNAL